MSSSHVPGSGVQKLDAKGGKGGSAWDDGYDHDVVTRIILGSDVSGVLNLKFYYDKDLLAPRENYYIGYMKMIDIKHPDEYLISVEGWFDSSNVIRGIKFITNHQTSRVYGHHFEGGDGTEFALQVQGKKIIGFHGSSATHLHSIGAYVVPIPPKIPEAVSVWDDGMHAEVKRVQLTYEDDVIYSIQVTYNGAALPSQLHGSVGHKSDEFTLESDEYITALSRYRETLGSQKVITALTFTTNKTTYGPYGNKARLQSSAPTVGDSMDGTPITLQVPGEKIIGFRGSSGTHLNSIEAYFAPIDTTTPPPTPAGKIPAVGEDGGTPWDDVDFDGVRAVYVGQGELGIGAVKFVYDKDAQAVEGHEHGELTGMGYEEFVLDWPNEYITAVHGTFDKIYGSDPVVITMLRFTTNKRTSKPFGFEVDGKLDGVDKHFQLKEDGKKIVGFHGSAGEFLHKIGVHVLPITN